MLEPKNFEVSYRPDGSKQIRPEPSIRNLHGFESVTTSRQYPRGSVLFVEGQQPRGIYVLGDGRAKIYIGSPEGKTLLLRVAQPGEVLGLNASLTGQPYAATAETLEPSRIEFVSRDDLFQLLENDKSGYVGVVQSLSRKLNSLVQHARLLFLSHNASQRLARLLIQWCDERGTRTPQGIRVSVGLTHEEISQMIGLSRETVTRVLNMFKRMQVVGSMNGDLLIRKPTTLVALANDGA